MVWSYLFSCTTISARLRHPGPAEPRHHHTRRQEARCRHPGHEAGVGLCTLIAIPASPSCRLRSAQRRRAASRASCCRRRSPSRPICRPLGPDRGQRERGSGATTRGDLRRMRPGDLLGARRGPLHPTEPPGHPRVMPLHRRRRELGRRRGRWAPRAWSYINSSNLLHRITLFPASDYAEMKKRFRRQGSLAAARRPLWHDARTLVSPLGLPCNPPPPWGVLTALDLGSRKILWQVPLGTTEELNPAGPRPPHRHADLRRPARHRERPSLHRRPRSTTISRAFDAKTGAEGSGPADYLSAGIATPTSYLWQGRQYVVIVAGGHGRAGLGPATRWSPSHCPRAGESGPSPWFGWLDRPGGRFKLRTPGWREPPRSRWRRCGCGGSKDERVTGCRPEQPRRTRRRDAG